MSCNKETGMWEGYVYQIWNDVNSKKYIGQTTTTLKDRWHGHMSAALSEKRYFSFLYSDMRYFGRDKFHIGELEKVVAETREELIARLNELEQFYIKELGTMVSPDLKNGGYNIESGGDNKHVEGCHVCKYDIKGNFIQEYDSFCEAARDNGIDSTTIWAVCRHDYFTAGGFAWARKGEQPIIISDEERQRRRVEGGNKTWATRRKTFVPKPKIPKPYVSKAMPKEQKHKLRLDRLGWNGERIVVYDAFGNQLAVYEDIADAIDNIPINSDELKKNLGGTSLCYKRMVIRYEGDAFDKYPMSQSLQPVSIYDLQGNHIVDVETLKDADTFVGCSKGEASKAIKRGGSIKGYLLTPYGKPLDRKLYRQHRTYEMLDADDNVIKTFSNSNEIAEMFDAKWIGKNLRKAIKDGTMPFGYRWRYKEEYPVS